jgi:hypothetical protein
MDATVDIRIIALIIPSCDAPCWPVITLPLLNKIKAENGIKAAEIIKWGKTQKFTIMFTRNLLAWLSFRELVVFDSAKGLWFAK